MTATLADILDALADQIRGEISQLAGNVVVEVEPRMVLEPSEVTVDMYPADPSNDPQYAGFGELIGGELVTIRARIGAGDSAAAQDVLLGLMDDEDPLSLVAAVETDPTLGGLAAKCLLSPTLGRSGYRDFPSYSGEGSWLGCLWNYVIVKARS